MTILEALSQSIHQAAVFNSDVQAAPACVLWPDHERLWESVITRIQAEMPELLVLGDYAPETRRGPAIWLRCAIAETLDEVELADDATPVLYLPGVSRQDLRAVSDCPQALKPLAELQYRGVIWSQVNAKDWTPRAFLVSDQGGLGLDVEGSAATGKALQSALKHVLAQDVETLANAQLNADTFNNLLTGGDPVRDLLRWLDDAPSTRGAWSDEEWHAFVQVCGSNFGFNPMQQSALEGLQQLVGRAGAWDGVWQRYAEAPKRYPNIAPQLRQLPMPAFDMFPDEVEVATWPQYNDQQEEELYQSLCALKDKPAHQAREQLLKLAQVHSHRREWVWAELDESSLASAMSPLRVLAEVTCTRLAGGNAEDMRTAYVDNGWRADDALLHALACVRDYKTQEAITKAICAVYTEWAEAAAEHLQAVWQAGIDGLKQGQSSPHARDAECVLFVDGLRFDCGQRLVERLRARALEVEDHVTWTALPSVTGTGKYAVAPVLTQDDMAEEPGGYQFTPITSYLFQKLLRSHGWQVLDHRQVEDLQNQTLDTSRPAWCAFGDIDHAGHERGWKLARSVDDMLAEVEERIQALLAQGWSQVRVVTDHGWLLLPGGLPKTELPASLTESKWGRCAQVKPGSQTDYPLYPWYWNESEHFALAKSIRCFKAGEEYTHGGLSLQECVTPELVVTGATSAQQIVRITDLAWKGLRCTVVVEGDADGLQLDVRQHAADANSSVSVGANAKPFKSGGKASVVVDDDELEGETVQSVVLNSDGQVVAQESTVVGGED